MDHGVLDQAGDRWQLTFRRTLRHPPEKVWRALTEPEHVSAWFPSDIEGERKAGAALRFVFREDEGPTIDGEMISYEPPSLLEFRWGDEEMRFELRGEGGGTLLTFVNTFGELGKAARDAAGWHGCLDLLGFHLDGTEPPVPTEDLWGRVHPGYVERFGPAASTIGPPG